MGAHGTRTNVFNSYMGLAVRPWKGDWTDLRLIMWHSLCQGPIVVTDQQAVVRAPSPFEPNSDAVVQGMDDHYDCGGCKHSVRKAQFRYLAVMITLHKG